MKGRYLVAIAVVVFLIFIGVNGYHLLCPGRWSVACGVANSSGAIAWNEGRIVHTEAEAKTLAADGEKFGRICFVNPIKECQWNRYF